MSTAQEVYQLEAMVMFTMIQSPGQDELQG